MSSDTLLTELCSICYTDKPKYRCPRCQTRTCCLACSKKHKQRASCSGVRDPAEYRKKNELATPVGVDRDYNYLKSVERGMDVANRDSEARGIDMDGKSQRHKGIHPESVLQKYLVKNNITLHRAPKGMTRQKTNKTRASNRNHVMWTVEWVDASGKRDISDNCLESNSLCDLQSHLQSEKRNAEKRSVKQQRTGGSSKRAKAELPTLASDDQSLQAELDTSDADYADIKTKPDGPSTSTDSYFYLLRTGTSSTAKVLIPLDSAASLTNSLQGQTVLEFPTIYVLPHSPETLPSEFLLERQYFKLRKGEDDELDEAVKKAEDDGLLSKSLKEEVKAELGSGPDPNAILAMLKRDVTR